MKQPVASRPAKPPAPPNNKRLWLLRSIALLLPLLLLTLLEGGLRLAGYGHDLRLFVTDAQHPDYWVMNPYASRRYFTQASNAPVGNFELFRKQKAPGTFRVFVLGESTTIGYPYMHNGAFPRWLHYRLLRTLPGQNLEIINLSMTAVNSYTMLGFAEELIEYQPDAVLVYAGHNEYYGALGVGSTSQLGSQPGLVRALLRLRGLRLVQGLSQAVAAIRGRLGGAPANQRQTLMQRMAADQQIGYNSPVYARGIRQFESNMSQVCQLLSSRRVPVFISTLVSNEKDLKPFSSADAQPEGSANYHFQQAAEAYQQGRFAQARQQFAAAKELDLLRFRAPAALNQVIRQLPGRYPGVYLVDAEQLFRQHSPHGILGQELLLEHVHPNLAGYALLSEAFYQALKKQQLLPKPPQGEMSFAQLQKQMPITAVDSLKGAYEVRLLRAGWPFHEPLPPGWQPGRSPEAQLASALLANRLSWNDAMEQLMNHYLRARNAAGARRVAEAVLLEYPYDPTFYQYAGQFSQQAGQPAQAALYFQKAFQLRPTPQLAQALFGLHLQLDEPAQAAPYVAYASAKTPGNARLRELQTLLQAMAQQQAAVRVDSGNAAAMRALVVSYQLLGNQEMARRYASRVARLARSAAPPRGTSPPSPLQALPKKEGGLVLILESRARLKLETSSPSFLGRAWRGLGGEVPRGGAKPVIKSLPHFLSLPMPAHLPTPPTTISLNRRFGLLVGGALLLGAGYYYLRHQALRSGLLVGGSLLWLLAGLVPGWLTPLRLGWEKLGQVLGQINTYGLLLLAYGLVCVPLGGLLRLLGKDPLGRKRLPQAPTYWQPKETQSSMRFQF